MEGCGDGEELDTAYGAGAAASLKMPSVTLFRCGCHCADVVLVSIRDWVTGVITLIPGADVSNTINTPTKVFSATVNPSPLVRAAVFADWKWVVTRLTAYSGDSNCLAVSTW